MGIEEAVAAIVDLVVSAGAEAAGGAAIADTGLAAGATLAGDAALAGGTALAGDAALTAAGMEAGLTGAGAGALGGAAESVPAWLSGADVLGGTGALGGTAIPAEAGGAGVLSAGSWIPGAVDVAPWAGGLNTAAFDSTMAGAAEAAGGLAGASGVVDASAGALPTGAVDYGAAGTLTGSQLGDNVLKNEAISAVKDKVTGQPITPQGMLKTAFTTGAEGLASDALPTMGNSAPSQQPIPSVAGSGSPVDTSNYLSSGTAPDSVNPSSVGSESVSNPSATVSPEGSVTPSTVTPNKSWIDPAVDVAPSAGGMTPQQFGLNTGLSQEAFGPGSGDSGSLSGLKTLGQSLGLVNKDATGVGSNLLPAAGLGLSAYTQMQGANATKAALGGKTTQQIQAPVAKAQAAAETQKAEVSQQIMSQYQSGKLNASDAQQIDDWKTAQIAQSRAYYAKAGLSDSSMEHQAEASIEKTAVGMRDQALQNMLKTGISAAGSSTPALNSMAMQQTQQDTALQNAMANFLRSSGKQEAQITTP